MLDAEGKPVSVREALALINQILDEVLTEQEGDFDADSRWALAWFEQHGFNEGEYGVAETLSKAKNTSIAGIVEGGILKSYAGKVRLLRPDELVEDWDPATDTRLTVWEAVHRLIRTMRRVVKKERHGLWLDLALGQMSLAKWPIGFMQFVSVKTVLLTRSPITVWFRAGPRLLVFHDTTTSGEQESSIW